jgi:hypothetical protein
MRYDAATRWVCTHRAGEAAYYMPRQRGTVTVAVDSKIYVYRFGPDPDRRAAKRALIEAFFDDGKIEGRWPEYRIAR